MVGKLVLAAAGAAAIAFAASPAAALDAGKLDRAVAGQADWAHSYEAGKVVVKVKGPRYYAPRYYAPRYYVAPPVYYAPPVVYKVKRKKVYYVY